MIHVGAGMTKLEKTREAAKEATSLAAMQLGTDRAECAVVFATVEHCRHYQELLAGLRQVIQVDHVVGSSGRGVLTTAGEIDDGVGLAVMLFRSDTIHCIPFVIPNLQEGAMQVGHRISEHLKPQLKEKGLLLLFPDPFSLQPELFFRALTDRLGVIEIVGGASGEDGVQRQTFQFCDDEIVSDAVAGLCLTGDFRYQIGMTQAYHPLSELLTITRSEGNIIAELNGRPASSVLRELTRPFGLANQQTLLHLLGIGIPVVDTPIEPIPRGHYLVRNFIGVDFISGAIAAAGQFLPDQRIFFAVRDTQRSQQDLEEMLEELASAMGQPACGFYFNCSARGQALHPVPNVDTSLIHRRFGALPLIGFFSYAEIAPILKTNLLHSYSGVLTLLAD